MTIDSAARWYLDAIIYEVHVKSFFDSNDDGIGDFEGLRQKLDYLQDLGVTAIWLLPFYPSPLRDDGYDISDYRSVHPTYGTLREFRRFVREAHARGLKVITELVINHTSDQHPWFQRARHAKSESAWRNYYVWSDTDQQYHDARIIFVDSETSNWAWDPEARAYYWHRFYTHQPDLNFDNPRVLRDVISVMRFWMDMGVDGMRLDAIPYLCEREETNCENLPETHAVIKKIRAALDARYTDRMLLAEANQWPEDVRPYFGDGDECHLAYHFPLMPRIYMALANEDRHPITDIMRQTPDLPEGCQWAIFLRNHDELTLEMVTDRERDYLWRHYAADTRARLNLGIRRRLAPLLDNDRRKIELLNSLLMSMPGTPIIYYGDEIGMGDNIFLGDRHGVRTPMQWSPDRNAGFSRADPAQLYLPPIMDAVYGFGAVNVEAQSRSPSSLLNWMKRLMAARKQHKSLGPGTLTFLYPGNRKVLAYLRQWEGEIVLCVANLSRAPQPAELDLSAFDGRIPIELLGRSAFPPIGTLPYFITLPGYGFYWFLLAEEAEAPKWHEPSPPPAPELVTIVLPQGWASLLVGEPAKALETRVLPEFLAQRRWFGAKDRAVAKVDVVQLAPALHELGHALFVVLRVGFAHSEQQETFNSPLTIVWEDAGEERLPGALAYALARVRSGGRVGFLADAMGDDNFVRGIVAAMRDNREIDGLEGRRLAFRATSALPRDVNVSDLMVQRTAREQSNTSVHVGEDLILKLYRRLQPGIHPEVEVGNYLTEVAKFANTPALLGSLVAIDEGGQETALAALSAYVRNQGDGWDFTLDYLKRFVEEADILGAAAPESLADRHAVYLSLAATLGRRIAELHGAFARPAENDAFAPEPIGQRDVKRWLGEISERARAAFATVQEHRGTLTGDARKSAQRFLKSRRAVMEHIKSALPDLSHSMKTRCHGDLHLGQVIVVQNDFFFVDFEGEPAAPLAERRAKHMPLRDVAGMLRSFDYASWAMLRADAAVRPESHDLVKTLLTDWRRRVQEAFMRGYREAIRGCPSCPEKVSVQEQWINFFMLEKALYEVTYEAANRPAWIDIPMEGVLELVGAKA